MFDTARLKLTLWYLVAMTAIVVLLSAAMYDILLHLEQVEAQSLAPIVRHGVAMLFARDEHTLILEIATTDLGLLIVAVLGAYALAGRTLRPIQEAMERQERFAMAASHELRTPLTVLQGTLEVALLQDRTQEEYKETISKVKSVAELMGMLVGDLVTLARVRNDWETLVQEHLDLREVVREAAEGMQPLAQRKGQILEVTLDELLPVHGDQHKLHQAITDLLDNAVIYTPEGGMVCVTAYQARGRAVIAVRDTGPGIESRHLAHLFEPFYRVDSARSDGSEHSGLGLALASWIVRAHGGCLAVESHVGIGTTFTLSLPLQIHTSELNYLA